MDPGTGDAARPDLRNLLEPRALVDHFLAAPPVDFSALTTGLGTPAFFARFDVLTTVDDALRRRIAGWPLYHWWRHWLQLRTCFIGTTVSEYALFPAGVDADALVDEWLTLFARQQMLLIVKDIPQESPLLDRASNACARSITSACERAGFVLLEGQALAWVPIDFESTDEYLGRLSASRRKDIRRKLRARAELDIEKVSTGAPLFRDLAMRDLFYTLYVNVYVQSEVHFDQLSRTFFDAIVQDADSGGIVFVYRLAGRIIGWNLCFTVGDTMVDKYVGFAYPAAREHNLYFISWMHNLEFALQQGLACYVAGWTDPEIKSYLGARFTFTRHAVRPRNRLLRAALRRIARYFQSDRAWADGKSIAEKSNVQDATAHAQYIARSARP